MAPMTIKSSYYNGALTGDEIKYYALWWSKNGNYWSY